MLFVSNSLFGIYFYPVNFSLLLVCTFHSIFYYLFWICRCLWTLISNLEDKIFTLKTWLFISEVQTWSTSVCYWYYYYFFFLKSMRHLLKINKNKTLKNLRLWDSEGLKLDGFWIFTEISKYEQLYLLFTSIRISVFMLVWKSPRCSLRKYIVLCTHIIVIKCYSFSKIEKNSNSHFFILFHCQHPHNVPKPYWYVLKMAFHVVFQVCFMLPETETLEQAHSGVTRT